MQASEQQGEPSWFLLTRRKIVVALDVERHGNSDYAVEIAAVVVPSWGAVRSMSMVDTTMVSNVADPTKVAKGTSAASRPTAIRTRPSIGAIRVASKRYQSPAR